MNKPQNHCCSMGLVWAIRKGTAKALNGQWCNGTGNGVIKHQYYSSSTLDTSKCHNRSDVIGKSKNKALIYISHVVRACIDNFISYVMLS